MIQFLKNIFGLGTDPDFVALLKNGAIIIDVRTKGEYAGGHIEGSLNIPLDVLSSKLNSLNKNKPIITVCASGMRSASAKNILAKNGFSQVYNGGGWMRLASKIGK